MRFDAGKKGYNALGNTISNLVAPQAAAAIPREGATGRVETNPLVAGRGRTIANDLLQIFGDANSALKRDAQLAIGHATLNRLSALHMRNFHDMAVIGDPNLREAVHYHGAIRDRIEQFRRQNPEIYIGPDPQLAYFAESRLIHTLYEKLSRDLPHAVLGAACSEFAQCCFHSTLQQQPDAAIELMHLMKVAVEVDGEQRMPDHAFVVIGRDAATDPEDFEGWNSDAVVCDASRGLVYSKNEIAENFGRLATFTHGSTRTELLARVEPGIARPA